MGEMGEIGEMGEMGDIYSLLRAFMFEATTTEHLI